MLDSQRGRGDGAAPRSNVFRSSFIASTTPADLSMSDPAHIPTIVIRQLANGPTPPVLSTATGPGALHTRVAEVVRQMGAPPWSKRIIADERQLVTLIASPPGNKNRPHWHREFDE